jgi:hypothetical protein
MKSYDFYNFQEKFFLCWFISMVVFAVGFFFGYAFNDKEPIPAPDPISFTMNLPPGLLEINSPILEMDCDRDPHVTLSGANITMSGGNAPAINVGTNNEKKDAFFE